MEWIDVYVIAVNAIAFIITGLDKSRAKSKGRRIPENQLFASAALGGAAGVWLAMQLFRHKTKHKSFVIGIPVLLVLNALLFYYFKLRS